MAHYCICAVCGVRFDRDKEQAVIHGPRRYSHQACEPDKELVPMPQVDPDLVQLKEYISNLYGSKANWQLIMKQIKDFHNDLNYSYSGILGTLAYLYEIKGGSVDNSNGGIGIVKFVYDEAKQYYAKRESIKSINSNKNIYNFLPKEKVVTIKEPRPVDFRVKLFNMDWEEDE